MDTVIQQNVLAIQQRMEQAALRSGRAPEACRLIAVTKAVPLDAVEALHAAGLRTFGENRMEIARDKIEAITERHGGEAAPVQWHMIGHVQRRKARDIVNYFDTVDSIDRLSLAEALERRCEELDKTLDCLVEVNVSGEESKQGFAPEQVEHALRAMGAFERLTVQGLMTMAPWGAPEAEIRRIFNALKTLTDNYGLPECSMGMTDDFELAIEEGATQVRIGRALFEKAGA